VIRDHAQRPAIAVETASIDLDLLTTWTTGLATERLVAHGFEVHLAWDERGRFNLDRRWLPPPSKPPDPTVPRTPPRVALEGLDLQGGLVTLTWPTWSLRFDGITSGGEVSAGGSDGLEITADLRGLAASARVGDRTLRFDHHVIDGFLWREDGFRADSVTLSGPPDAQVQASGEMDFSAGLALDAVGSVALPAPTKGTLLAPWLPEGASVAGLTVERAAYGPWSIDATAAIVPRLQLGQVNVTALKASFEGAFALGSLLPRLLLRTREASAEVLEVGDSLRAEGLSVGALDVDVGAAVDASAEALEVSSLSVDGHAVSDLVLGGTVVVNVGGGVVDLALTSAEGGVSVSGPVETQVLRRRADAALRVSFDRVRGGLRALVGPLLPAAERPSGDQPMRGVGSGRLGISASTGPTWSWTSFEWVGGDG